MTENAPYEARPIDQLTTDELYTLLAMIEQKHNLVFSVWSKEDILTIFTEEGMNAEGAQMVADVFWSESEKEQFAEYINHISIVLNYHRKNRTAFEKE